MIRKQLEDYLDRNHINYLVRSHAKTSTAHDVAVAEHIPDHEVAKTVVFCADGGYGVAVLPADSNIDIEKLRYKLGVKELRLATEDELSGLFPDVALGAMPPFGTLYDLPVYVDESLTSNEVIAFNAGTHTDVVYIKTEDYLRLADPLILSFARMFTHRN